MNGDLVDHSPELTMEDLCEQCGLSKEVVTAYIEHGLIEAQGDTAQWRFSQLSVVRLQTAHRVEKDLRLNPAGATLALELMSEIEDLKRQLRRYTNS